MSEAIHHDRVLVRVEGLVKRFPKFEKRTVTAFLNRKKHMVSVLNRVTLTIQKGEALGLIGESGCGKTTFGRCILRLTDSTEGRIYFEGRDLLTLKPGEMRRMRKKMQMIFQDPYAALNPQMKVREILSEAVQVGTRLGQPNEQDNSRACDVASKLLDLIASVNLQKDKLDQYPSELSGGERRRVGIARILAVEPTFIVADEPLASLDASIRSQILNLLVDLKTEHGQTFLYISHDIGAVRHICDRVAVMYLGNIVEIASRQDVRPERCLHPYTARLLGASAYLSVGGPPLEPDPEDDGEVAVPEEGAPGCSYRFRCSRFKSLGKPNLCAEEKPKLETPPTPYGDTHRVACHYPNDENFSEI